MASIEEDAIKGMLQALEHVLDSVDRVRVAALQFVNAQKTGQPLSTGHTAALRTTAAGTRSPARAVAGCGRSLVDTPRTRALMDRDALDVA
jgi:hypothetical protein